MTNKEIFNYLSPKYNSFDLNTLTNLIEIFKKRAENINDIEEGIDYMLCDDLDFYSKDALQLIENADKKVLKKTVDRMQEIKSWNALFLENFINPKL